MWYIQPLTSSPVPPPTDLEISVGPEDTNFTNGSSSLLECSARGFPQPIISWTKVVEGQTVSLELGGRVQILENGSLSFSEVIMEDLGIYKCTATNSLGNSQESDAAMVMVFGKCSEVPCTVHRSHERSLSG